MGKPVNCTLSNTAPDEYILRSLEKEAAEKALANSRQKPKPSRTSTKQTQRIFISYSVACGSMDYVGSDLAFTEQYQEPKAGRLNFGRKFVLIEFPPPSPALPTKQIEIPSYGIESLTIGTSTNPYLTFSLAHAPKFFEKRPQSETSLMNNFRQLGLQTGQTKQNDPERRRTTAIDLGHQAVVASCFCYRFQISPTDIRAILALRRLRGYPDVVSWDISKTTKNSFQAQKTQLDTALATRFRKYTFELKFQLQKLAQNGYLPPYKVLQLMQMMKRTFLNADYPMLAAAVRKLCYQIPFAGAGTEASELSIPALEDLLRHNYDTALREKKYAQDITQKYEHIAAIHKATVTPAGIYLYGPEPEVKNQVLRTYSAFISHFLQVTFSDEDGEPMRFDRTSSLDDVYQQRFKKVLGVIKDLGEFGDIRSPAKCAARIGQAFSQAFSSVQIPEEAFMRVPEIKRVDTKGILRTFSDGVGICSKAILRRIWAAYAPSRTWKPTVCQIRYAGAKGMISLDDRLEGEVLCLRPSMIKFEATSNSIEICGAGFKPLPMYLNRQLIKILEDLRVPKQAFLELQAEAVEQLRFTTESPINASTYLQRNVIGKAARLPWLIKKLYYIGMSFNDDRFLRDTLELAILIQLRELKYRSRIHVERGITVYGILDETGYLNEGQIYCPLTNDKSSEILTGRVLITRSPALHPGDVQYVDSVDVPLDSPLRSLSGGDLDGDLYNIIFDDSLMPKILSEPADYASAPPIDIGREVVRSDMTDFFVQFMQNDQLGRLSTLHQTLADQKQDAVDFSKTGIPVDLTQIPRSSNIRPDFQAPGPRVLIEEAITVEELEDHDADEDDNEVVEETQPTRYYRSEKVLGQLYRAIDEHDFFEEIQRHSRSARKPQSFSLAEEVWKFVREKTALIQYKHYLPFARDIKEAYETNLIDTIRENSFHPTHFVSEVEVFAGALLGKDGAQSKRQREYSTSMKEKHDRDVAYTVQCILQGVDEEVVAEEALERSIACLDVAVHESYTTKRFGRLESFTWVAAAICLREVEKLAGH
ncbi:MAG: hypothetical protein Q9200_002580 [Gallowayella weberi]